MKLVIIGGVAGGASAAARARRLDERAEIILIERGPDVSFANCGLPYYIGGQITQRDKLLVAKPELLRNRLKIDVRTQSEVISIDRSNQTVRIRDLTDGRQYDQTYDKLILSPGAAPIVPPLPGVDLPGLYTLRNLPDTDRIKAAVDSDRVRHVVVIGAGFIGLEMVENLVERGKQVTLVELQDQVLPPLDKEMTAPILQILAAKQVRVVLGQSADGFENSPEGIDVLLKSGERLTAQLVVLGVGVRPENQLATAAGLEIGPRGGIRVNQFMQTSDPLIFAVGDAVETTDFLTGDRTQVPLAGPANRQGRIAADNALGRESTYRGTQGTAIVGVFDCVAAATGLSEKSLRRLKKPFLSVYVHPTDHAGYYPGAERMVIKLLFDPADGRILGAQAVGGAGVDKRIDVLAMAIQANMTVYDLEQAELCYAPQFGSAKDPVNMAGFVAAGVLRGDHPQLQTAEVLEQPAAQRPLLLDVRSAAEFNSGHIPGATHIPVDELRERLSELPHDKLIAAYCQVGQRGYLATRILLQHGFNVANLSGGYLTYELLRQTQSTS